MSNMTYKKKKYYPSKRKHKNYPQKRYHPPNSIYGGFFTGNLANNMHFGSRDHAVSGYVKREVYMRDHTGNVQRFNETQFFNSAKMQRVEVVDMGRNGGKHDSDGS